MDISIEKAKQIREDIGATHLILFAHAADGSQNVATHGGTEEQAHQAADFGNALKKTMGWPEELCKSTPQQREDWNRKTVSQIKARIEALRKEGEEYSDKLGEMGWTPDNAEEIDSLNTSMAQVTYAIWELEWVLKAEEEEENG